MGFDSLKSLTAQNNEYNDSVEYDFNDINKHLDFMVLELSRVFGDKLAFKGGYMLTKMIGDVARQTTDIDFSIASDELYEMIKDSLLEIASSFMDKNIIDDYKLKETIQPRCSGGVDFYKDGQKILGVDIGWHDISYGTTMMELDIGSIRTFEVERMLADKITAILSRKRFRRPKDIYDLYCISNCLSFDASKVAEYILNRTEGVGAEWGNFPFSDTVLKEYEKAYNSLTLTSIHKNRVLERPLFMKVYERFCVIAWKVKEPTYEIYWSKERKCFVYDR